MIKDICINENGIKAYFKVTSDGYLRLYHMGINDFDESTISHSAKSMANHPNTSSELIENSIADEQSRFNLVEADIYGFNRPREHHGNGFAATNLGTTFKYKCHHSETNDFGPLYIFTLYDEATNLECEVYYQFFTGLKVVRSYTKLINTNVPLSDAKDNEARSYTLSYLSSLCLNGLTKELVDQGRTDDAIGHYGKKSFACDVELKIPHNSWCRELHWRNYTLDDLGFVPSIVKGMQRSSKVISFSNTGNWSTKEYLPMGYLSIGAHAQEDGLGYGHGLLFQIEQQGSWHWELGDQANQLYLQLSGPEELHNHFYIKLKPGDSFTSVPCALAFSEYCGEDGFIDAMGTMNSYRRRIRRVNDDNKKLPIIFNCYMNCIFGDPTTQNLIPLIDKAAEAGCEYFCIDAGWYDKGYWWDNVGEWQPSPERFPEGIKYVLDYIRSKNMVPGLWLEIEVMGIKSPKLKDTDDSWFFMRHGSRIYDRSRFQLDFTCAKVREHATSVIERLVNEYGVGYIRMDYNIEPGIGTDQYVESAGLGLLNHNRAYLQWLKDMFKRFPDLVIENCSSGGLRMDYALLSQCSVQSTSDQEDYLNYATIAANAPTGVTNEQAAIWSYPMLSDDADAVAFNQVSAMLCRIHQSGHLAKIKQEHFNLIKEALDFYKDIRLELKDALPSWPLGLSKFDSPWSCLVMHNKALVEQDKSKPQYLFMSVWHRNSKDEAIDIPLPKFKGKELVIEALYPNYLAGHAQWQKEQGTMHIKLKSKQALCLKCRVLN